jgi:mono/diheme cytochrome c family protein
VVDRRILLRLLLAGAVVVVMASAGVRAQTSRYASEGVYTTVQADRGEREFGRSCEHCHGKELEGDGGREVPALVGDAFLGKWRGRPVKELYELLRQSMPADNRGKLSARSYTELVAFLLKTNGFPDGATDLPAVDALDGLVIGAP